jgi:cellulose synthase/poly-beta-1,6-N-acetylglucosamine synthase-like glycosyltransferase
VAALRWILQNSSARFVVLVDSDSLVIGPFATSIEAAFRAMPDVGYLGSNRRDSRGLRPPPEFQPVRAILAKLLQPFAVWMRRKPWRGIQCSAFGSWKRLRQVIELAVSRGYELGDFVHGGGSVIRREALDAIDDLGLLDDPLMWIETPIGGDVALSIYVAAAGYRFADFVDDGQVFAVQTTGLCDDPDRLIERGFSIVHSVKGDSRLTESQIREHFRLTRRRARP